MKEQERGDEKKPQYVKIHDLLYDMEELRNAVTAVTGKLLENVIETSQKPQSVVARMEHLKQHPNTRAIVWTKAAETLIRAKRGFTPAEVSIREGGEEYEVVPLNLTVTHPVAPGGGEGSATV
jgi:hypothetical protein